MRILRPQALFFILLLPAILFAADTGVLRDRQHLYKEKSPDESIATLQAGEVVDILTHSNSWFEVRTATGKTGWIPLNSIKLDVNRSLTAYLQKTIQGQSPGKEKAEAEKENIDSTEAVRGMRHDNLDVARADREAVKALDTYVQELSDIKDFANELGLKPTSLEYLASGDEKAKSSTTTTTGQDFE